MSKIDQYSQPNGSSCGGQSMKLARRQRLKENQKRSNLLTTILEESSSLLLNDPTSQTSARQALENHSRLFDLIEELREIESPMNPKFPTRDENSWLQFTEWIDKEFTIDSNNGTDEGTKLFDRIFIRKKNGIEQPNASANVQMDKTNEFALIAKVPFTKGERIFNIGRRLMLTTETAMRDVDLCEFIKKDSVASGMQNVVLVLHVLNEKSKQEQSFWSPYLSILPNKILPVLQMNKKQLKSYLFASAHLFEILKMFRAIVRQYAYFYKCLQATRLPLRKEFTFLSYTWGVSIVCSRQNEIPSSYKLDSKNNNNCSDHHHSAQMIHALIPVLDMCNHDWRSNQALFENDSSSLMASDNLLPDQEITINYGTRSSGDFYIHNGFVPDEVPFDSLPLSVSLGQKQDLLFENKVKLLKILNMPATFGQFKLRLNNYENRHRRDPHLTMFLIVCLLNDREIDHIMTAENPVGVADEIYEHVQYKSNDNFVLKQQQAEGTPTENGAEDKNLTDSPLATACDGKLIDKMRSRLTKSLEDYLSRRSNISLALLDRSIEDLERLQCNEGGDAGIGADFISSTLKLLQHEKLILSSYVMA